MTYAIIETGGKQLRVEPGRFYDVELLHVDEGDPYTIDKVLMVHDDEGNEIHVGQPYVAAATVDGVVLRHFRGKKIIVYKMKPKKKTRKKRGHRQEQTRLMIAAIKIDGTAIASAELDFDFPVRTAETDEEDAIAMDAPVLAAVETAPPVIEEIEPEAIEATEPVAEADPSETAAPAVITDDAEAEAIEPEAIEATEADPIESAAPEVITDEAEAEAAEEE